jgi:hypothetical protein
LARSDKEGHSILINGIIHQEEVAIVNLYGLNVDTPNFIKQTLLDLKAQMDPYTTTVGDYNTLLSLKDR